MWVLLPRTRSLPEGVFGSFGKSSRLLDEFSTINTKVKDFLPKVIFQNWSFYVIKCVLKIVCGSFDCRAPFLCAEFTFSGGKLIPEKNTMR